MVDSGFLAVVPDLYDGAGVILCNPERLRLITQLRQALPRDAWDAGESGESAAESAEQFARSGRSKVRIIAGPRDRRGAFILERACRAAGLSSEILLAGADGNLDCVPRAEQVPLPEPHPGLVTLAVPAGGDSRSAWLERCRSLCAVHGEDKVRILPRPLESIPQPAPRRSPLPAGLGLEDTSWRQSLVSLVAECWPRAFGPFLATLGARDLGTNAREDIYAGLGLREHNSDLLVNIIDDPDRP